MCGRFTHMHSWQEVHSFLSLDLLRGPVSEALFEARFNVAPSQIVPVVRAGEGGVAEIAPMKWGLLPSWAKDTKRAPINARAETVTTNGMFRNAFKRRRCLVLAGGFYEWQVVPGAPRKQPWFVYPAHEPMFAFGGLWETHGEGEARTDTFALVTTAANELMQPIHDRMPLILPRAARQLWLFGTPEQAAQLLVPAPGVDLAAHKVSERVNRPGEGGRALIDEVA